LLNNLKNVHIVHQNSIFVAETNTKLAVFCYQATCVRYPS